MAEQDRKSPSVIENFAEQAALRIYTFGRKLKTAAPEGAGRLGNFFRSAGKFGHFMRRDGWSTFTETVGKIGRRVGEFYMKATSTRAGALATGIVGGLGVWGVYAVAPPVALTVGAFALVGMGLASAGRGVGAAVAQIEASSDIKHERDWRRGDSKPSWTELPSRAHQEQEDFLLSPDDPANRWEYREEESAGRNWLTRRPSDLGRAQLPLLAANVVMFGTNPAGLITVAAVAFAPDMVMRGLGGVVNAFHMGQDGIRMLGEQVERGVEAARNKIAEKEARTAAAAEANAAVDPDAPALRPATAEDLSRPKGETVEFDDPGKLRM